MTELETWRDLYGQLRERGALLVAISPETQRQSDFAVQQHGLPFPLLHDPEAKLAEKFGLVYTVPEYHQQYLRSILVNLPFLNGESSWRLPMPATYVIDRSGQVVFGEAHADFRELLEDLGLRSGRVCWAKYLHNACGRASWAG